MIKYDSMSNPTIQLLVVASAECLRPDDSTYHVVTLADPTTQEPQIQLEVSKSEVWRFEVGQTVDWHLYYSNARAVPATPPEASAHESEPIEVGDPVSAETNEA